MAWDWLKTTNFARPISSSEKFNQSLWWALKFWKINTLPREVEWESLIYVTIRWDSIKNCKKKTIINDKGKGRKIVKEGKPVRNIKKNPQSYGIINIQKKVPLSDKL